MFRKFSVKVFLFILSFSLFSPIAFAAPWQFQIDPYIWAINMNGRVGVGPATAHVNESFSDVFKHLNFAAMVYAAAHKDRFGIYINGIYAVTSDNASVGPLDIDVKNRLGIFGAGLSYISYDKHLDYYRHFIIEPYAGFRYTFNDTTVNVNHLGVSNNQHWTDPLVGVQLSYDFTREWFARVGGDIGGTNRASQFSYSALGLLGYHPLSWKNTSVFLGYRLLSQHYQKVQELISIIGT